MSDKRSPCFTFLLKKRGKKTQKIELFHSADWSEIFNKFRIRVNGKWFNGKGKKMTFFYKNEVKNLMFKSIKFY